MIKKHEALKHPDALPPNPSTQMTTLVLNVHRLFQKLFGKKGRQANELGEYEAESVQKTLDNSYVPKPIRNARQIQDRILQERFRGRKLTIADIGCGDGYHAEMFASECAFYHGFEISPEMADKTRRRWSELGFTNTRVTEGNAATAELEPKSYDVVWSLYFTSGNFRDEFDDIRQYDDAYLDKNPAFIRIISNFYQALKPGGKLFLTVYKDSPKTEATQRKFYKQTGQQVITPLGSRFVATKENFWSVRWTKRSMLSNLNECGVTPDQVQFNDLNEVAWLVEITK